MTDLVDLLQELSFTQYEARAYIALLGASDCNGYEVAKASGIPRANVYPVLERLASRHAIRRIETRKGTRYAAAPPEQLVDRLGEDYQHRLDKARHALRDFSAQSPDTAVINLRDRTELLSQARQLLADAQTHLLVAIQPTEAAELAPDLAATRDRGVHITTLCMQACEAECGGCAGDIHRYALAPCDGSRWLMLVADGQRVLAGEMHSDSARAVVTTQSLIVELAAAYIRQSLALATMAGALGERFDGLLSAQTRKVLDDLHPEDGFLSWLRHVAGRETV